MTRQAITKHLRLLGSAGLVRGEAAGWMPLWNRVEASGRSARLPQARVAAMGRGRPAQDLCRDV